MTMLAKLKAQLGLDIEEVSLPTELSRKYMQQVAGGLLPGFDSFHQDAGPGGGGGFWKEITTP